MGHTRNWQRTNPCGFVTIFGSGRLQEIIFQPNILSFSSLSLIYMVQLAKPNRCIYVFFAAMLYFTFCETVFDKLRHNGIRKL
jgi:hypothetical protein